MKEGGGIRGGVITIRRSAKGKLLNHKGFNSVIALGKVCSFETGSTQLQGRNSLLQMTTWQRIEYRVRRGSGMSGKGKGLPQNC
jgi:hypothetical protein